MRTHEGKTRYMSPIYQPQHAVAEGKEPGFTYGSPLSSRFIPFVDLPGKHRPGKPFRYHGFSDHLREFFNKLWADDARERQRQRQMHSAMFDTISMVPVDKPGRHRLREENQWPTQPQNLLAEAAH